MATGGLSTQVVRHLREGALWVFGALALILWVALFTYHPADPGFTHATHPGEIQNGVGWVGALIADLLFNLFGRPAYLFTVMVFYLGWMIFNEQKTKQPLTRADFAFRFGGFVLTLVTSCALATLHFSSVGFRETAGGVVGQVVGGGLESIMKLLGASTLLFFCWLASISLFLGISWLTVMDAIGRRSLRAYESARARFDEFKDRAEVRRQQEARQDVVLAEKNVSRSGPRLESSPWCRCSKSASARSASVRFRCLSRPRTANFRHCRCSMIRRPRSTAIPRNRSRRCRDSSS